MKKFIAILCMASMYACSSSDQAGYKKAENAQEAGTEFIRASLDGNYDKAGFYLLKDSTNMLLFQKQQTMYKEMTSKEKNSYKNAAIRPVAITGENDSTVLYKYYHTSNPDDTTTLRIVRRNGDWLVDLKSVIKM